MSNVLSQVVCNPLGCFITSVMNVYFWRNYNFYLDVLEIKQKRWFIRLKWNAFHFYQNILLLYIKKKVCKLSLFTDYVIQGRELKYAVKSTQILNVGTILKIQAIPIFKTALKFRKQTQFSEDISRIYFGDNLIMKFHVRVRFVHTLSDPTLISVLAA